MPAARSVESTSTRHPKLALYAEAYDPLTRTWFDALLAAPELKLLLDEVADLGLEGGLWRLNSLFHELVDRILEDVDDGHGIVAVVSRHREHVVWEGHMAPGGEASTPQVRQSLAEKMKRNISLGVIEAIICLESAVVHCREHLGMSGEQADAVVSRSRRLYTSLAVLHDEDEKHRLVFLTGLDRYLMYPVIDYSHVLAGEIAVPADKFVLTGPADARALRFVAAPKPEPRPESPVSRCPAHRLRSPEDPSSSLNDVLWDLLIDMYRRAGRFA